MVDELAALVAGGDRDRDRENATALRHVLERGRAAGVASLQRPAAEIIPTAVRDVYQCRVLHALADRVSVEMAAGAGWATCRADTIPIGPKHAGAADVLLDGERQGRLARSYWCDPDTAAAVARRTAHLSHPWEALRPVAVPAQGPPRPTAPRAVTTPNSPQATELTLDADERAVLDLVQGVGRPRRNAPCPLPNSPRGAHVASPSGASSIALSSPATARPGCVRDLIDEGRIPT